MSHTKQTPILNYSTADLPVGDPAGSVVFNTDENCLNYYNGTEWVTSDDWESTYTTIGSYSGNWDSTYTTVSSNSATWDDRVPAVIFAAATKGTNTTLYPAVILSKDNLGYTEFNAAATLDIDATQANSHLGLRAVDLQLTRDTTRQVAGGNHSTIVGGRYNEIFSAKVTGGTTLNAGNQCPGAAILGGQNNFIGNGNTASTAAFCTGSAIIGGQNNKIDSGYCVVMGDAGEAAHPYTFVWSGDITTIGNGLSTRQADTFNILASNGLRLVHDTNDHTGDVLTCLDADGHGKWASLSADEWNSTYTTVNANSGIWGGAAALAYNAPTGTYSLEIGLLDGATQTGTDALTIQPGETRASVDNVAEGQGSIAIGKNTRVQGFGGIAIGSGANIVSSNTSQYSIALGHGASCQNNASVAIGYSTVAGLQGTGSNSTVAIGPNVVNRGTHSVAIGSQQGGSYTPGGIGTIGTYSVGLGYRTFAGGLNSIAIGTGVRTSTDNTAEVGLWSNPGFDTSYNAVRYAGIHIDRNSDNPMTSMSLLSSETAPIDGGAINGDEAAGTLPRKMVNLRRSESNFYLDANDDAGNITTVKLGGSNSQQTITSSTGTLTLDVSLGQSAITTLTEDITTFTIQNASAGDSGVLIISSDGGGWTFPDQNSLGASHIIHTGSSDSISTLTSTTSSAVSIGWYCDGSKQFLYISDPT